MTPGFLAFALSIMSSIQETDSDGERLLRRSTGPQWGDLLDLERPSRERGELRPFSILGRVEGSQQSLRITDSHNNFGLPPGMLKQELQVQESYYSGCLKGTLNFSMGRDATFNVGAALGAESIGTHFKAGPDNPVLGNPVGSTESDFDYGLALTWEAEAEFRYRFGGGPFDVTVSVDYRGGGDEQKDSISEEGYHYQRFRGGVFVGYSLSEEIRSYLGIHGSYYRARLRMKDDTTDQEFTLELSSDNPIDIAVGVELTSGAVIGSVEIDFVGSLTFVVSAGVRF